jgi:hypothetical protein
MTLAVELLSLPTKQRPRIFDVRQLRTRIFLIHVSSDVNKVSISQRSRIMSRSLSKVTVQAGKTKRAFTIKGYSAA